ncbi:MAG: LAGLIDADG family homing endonuclease [Candidatus Omnitrophota bacterium]|nr:LAGLIDADG family homing endonuclease [Candidatus Omnitrophota bacterium]
MDEVTKAYLAGIVDGEGTVTLSRHHKHETPAPLVSVSNTDLRLLKWIRYKAGGIITSKKISKPHHTQSYVWRLRQNSALYFLNEIKKYLIVKREQAELITKEYKKVTHRAGRYTSQLLHRKEKLVNKIRALNQR